MGAAPVAFALPAAGTVIPADRGADNGFAGLWGTPAEPGPLIIRETAARSGAPAAHRRPRPIPGSPRRLPALALPDGGLNAGEADPVQQAGRGRPIAGRAGRGKTMTARRIRATKAAPPRRAIPGT